MVNALEIVINIKYMTLRLSNYWNNMIVIYKSYMVLYRNMYNVNILRIYYFIHKIIII